MNVHLLGLIIMFFVKSIANAKVTTKFMLSNRTGTFKALATDSSVKTQLEEARDMAKRIVWIDLEMSGLDVERDRILEIACIITDAKLNVVATGPDIIIHQPDEVLNNMQEWCISQHGESGLTEASRKSTMSVTDGEKEILKFVKTHVPENKCPLGGNSVYMDKIFLNKYMPTLNSYLHYRIIDVSSIKELAKRWYGKEYSRAPMKKFKHRALDDILDTIEEMKYYKSAIFK